MALFGFGKKKERQQTDEAPTPVVLSGVVPLVPGGGVAQESDAPANADASGWTARLSQGLRKTSSALSENMRDVFVRKKIDAQALQDIEDALIMSDMGPAAASAICKKLADAKLEDGDMEANARAFIAEEITAILSPTQKDLMLDARKSPYILLLSGVNGSGKTTTAGKIAAFAHKQGLKTVLAACDTFRAAAVEQLTVWAERTGAELVKGEPGADPSSVAFRAVEQGRASQAALVIIDTAGRLQNKSHLMDELGKTRRALQKIDPTAPHESVIVVDGSTGGNAMVQIEKFKEAAALTGICVTKLDGSAKGGIVIRAAQEYALPIYAVGIGEKEEDLRAFNAKDFARSVAGITD